MHRIPPTLKLLGHAAACAAIFFSAVEAAQARNYYVSPTGDNSDGLSWKTAYTHLPSFQFGVSPLLPGDRVIIDGGTSGLNYGGGYQISVSGAAGNPIVIESSKDRGHNGPVIFSGTNGQGGQNQPVGVNLSGSNITLSGAVRGGIRVSDCQFQGIYVGGNNVILNNVAVQNVNGPPINPGHIPGIGLVFTGTSNRYQNLDIYNTTICAQEYASPNNSQTTVFDRCWFFDQYSRGNSGLQVSDNNAASRLYVHNCVFGPGLGSGLKSTASAGQLHVVGDLFLNASDTNIDLSAAAGSTAIVAINKITSFMTESNYQGLAHNCLSFNGNGTTRVDNSVFWGGGVNVPPAVSLHASGNFQYKTKLNTQVLAPTMVDPQFVDESNIAALTGSSPLKSVAVEQFEVASNSPAAGKGAVVTAAQQLNKNVAGFFP
ncbi:MAG: hypothetical protein JSS83_16370 [Cyanobacteria bacterium SZAS LIN-3]|nr:hypothetical protein [Cyanobacteria bacterium SZAS LIN-3]